MLSAQISPPAFNLYVYVHHILLVIYFVWGFFVFVFLLSLFSIFTSCSSSLLFSFVSISVQLDICVIWFLQIIILSSGFRHIQICPHLPFFLIFCFIFMFFFKSINFSSGWGTFCFQCPCIHLISLHFLGFCFISCQFSCSFAFLIGHKVSSKVMHSLSWDFSAVTS